MINMLESRKYLFIILGVALLAIALVFAAIAVSQKPEKETEEVETVETVDPDQAVERQLQAPQRPKESTPPQREVIREMEKETVIIEKESPPSESPKPQDPPPEEPDPPVCILGLCL
jgi:type IV secretory pathway VirB10-like protein